MSTRVILSSLLLCAFVDVSSVVAAPNDTVATTALTLTEPFAESQFIHKLSLDILHKECWSASHEVVVELDGGGVVLQYVDRYFNELNIVFGDDQRVVRPHTIPSDARWYFCFEILAQPSDFGTYVPLVKTLLVIPPDLSS